MKNSIAEIEGTDAFIIIGTNTTENHPVIGTKIKKRVKDHNAPSDAYAESDDT